MTAEDEQDTDLLELASDIDHGRVTVTGGVFTDLDARRLEHELIDAAGTQPGGTLAVDLSGVTFLPSRAIRSLVMAQRSASARGTTLRLLAAEGSLSRRMLRAVGFDVQDPIAADEDSQDGPPPWTAS
ncbi:anti-anti-sigma regulatory factor [Nocardioides zeae]|uniref:Anti-anti-sigma regulatory factor n=2 Tax=Nocardioides zeae TaxID=1457234 RepID=A0AAJ1U088_9ACTN|nr:STAS domain-containing protein [Nocardioides zeae]MDQ1105595.1 anti-anti-sigma regulatory factor [Nocardioides zeae]MDR6174724.1 anti-anti-sigma regulatory factor [Nocardioides zeae]MDR6210793.1 anti-anti-sigma regulatory factor [Nocardioides zeae]